MIESMSASHDSSGACPRRKPSTSRSGCAGTFFRLANSASAALRDNFGFAHGDRLAVLSANNPEWCESFWATVNLGGILVGLNGWWKTDEIVYGLQDSGARFLVALNSRPGFSKVDLDSVVSTLPTPWRGDTTIGRFRLILLPRTDASP